jgi:hypothetical protein
VRGSCLRDQSPTQNPLTQPSPRWGEGSSGASTSDRRHCSRRAGRHQGGRARLAEGGRRPGRGQRSAGGARDRQGRVEVPAPAAGVLREIVLHSDAEAAPGAVLGRIAVVAEVVGTNRTCPPSLVPSEVEGRWHRLITNAPRLRSGRAEGFDRETATFTGRRSAACSNTASTPPPSKAPGEPAVSPAPMSTARRSCAAVSPVLRPRPSPARKASPPTPCLTIACGCALPRTC